MLYLSEKLINKYIHIVCYGTSKRIRKKSWQRAIELVGTDDECLTNYAKLAKLLEQHKAHNKFGKYSRKKEVQP